MKKTTLEKVLAALESLDPRIEVPEDIAAAALASVERMIAIG
jgi:quinolinate synthase